jgi:dipeptidyl aminopeptidase/acylaminoacyl peptidase
LYVRYSAFGDASIWRISISKKTGAPRGPPKKTYDQLEALPTLDNIVLFGATQDLRQLVYARGSRFSNLWRIEGGSSVRRHALRPITAGTALRWAPAISPDGRWIAFAQKSGAAAELFRMPVEGGGATQITFDARVWPAGRIAWSPDGQRIAYESLRGGRPQVWIAHVDDGRYQPMPHTEMSPYTGHLAWSPGIQIAYQRFDRRDIELLDPVSGRERPLLADSAVGNVFSPQYSPDGQRLAVLWSRPRDRNQAQGDRERGVWVLDLESGNRVNVAQGWLLPVGWSKDGRYIYVQGRGSDIQRLDSWRRSKPEPVLTASLRDPQCAVVPDNRSTLVCASFDFVSDIWMIENPEFRP